MNLSEAEKAASKARLDEIWRYRQELQAIQMEAAQRETWTWISLILFFLGVAVGSRLADSEKER